MVLGMLFIREPPRCTVIYGKSICGMGTQFTSQFWKAFQKGLGTKVKLTTAFHPQIDGQVEQFAYNSSYHSSTAMDPFEELYGRRCRERLKTTQSRQKSYADVRRRDLEFEIGDWVYLTISPMKGVMRFGKKGKLSPRYVGPYVILKHVGKVAYELYLPNEFAPIHPVFHVSMLK
ncbi:hypothetical protein MTR67_002453 [Solanum verrucosum]|uniref:Tf2-1-like SH3-like domain-containing protein n=1 Tax=Solanum verrucosum TaxID=315347 RepID=A0AAF0T9F0_SOLVR|nr:hypothetical protein MTR67_002453 [Solanum verrucosum]